METHLPLAVVGAHLSGQPLNYQLTDLSAELWFSARTAPCYRLYALNSEPPKPGLVRVSKAGAAIELEVWRLPNEHVAAFLQKVRTPLCLGQVELSDGRRVHGFLCEQYVSDRARDITEFGSWRAFLAALT